MWPVYGFGCCVVSSLVVAWWLVSCGCCGGFLVVLAVAVVFGGCPSRYGVVGFHLGIILSFDSHHGCD